MAQIILTNTCKTCKSLHSYQGPSTKPARHFNRSVQRDATRAVRWINHELLVIDCYKENFHGEDDPVLLSYL